MSNELRIGLVQHACGDDRGENLKRSVDGIARAAGDGARLVLLQELHGTRYFCQTEDPDRFELAEQIPGPTTDLLARSAAEHDVVIVGSVFERRAAGLYHNTAVVLDGQRGLVGRYRKMHIPDDPGYHEKFYFTPGDQGFRPVTTSVGVLGVLVCWDQWYPEAARLMTLGGAQLLLFPTAIGWDAGDDAGERQRQREAWRVVQRAHAVANGLPVACCNRHGTEPAPGGGAGIEFWGSSFLSGPQGEILAEAPADADAAVVAAVDLGRNEAVRRIWPFLRDRRIDAYGDLTRRYIDIE